MLGPVFQLEMLTMPRRMRYYLARCGYALAMLLAFWFCYANHFGIAAHWTLTQSARFSITFFIVFAVIQLIAAILFTCAICAGTISQERQRRTIEYLFATDLTNRELVLGKLAARLLGVTVLLSTSVPILFFTLFFGGVSSELVVQNFLVSLSTVLMSASTSICISIWTQKPRDAVLRAFVALAFFAVFPFFMFPVATLYPTLTFVVDPLLSQIYAINPFLYLLASFGAPTSLALLPGWEGAIQTALKQTAVSLVLIVLAIWGVRRVHLNAAVKPSKERKQWRWAWWRPDIGRFPMLWKEMFGEKGIRDVGRWGRVVLVLLLLLIVTPMIVVFVKTATGTVEPDSYHMFSAVFTAAIGGGYVLVVGVRSASSISIERESQTWEMLLSTQLPAWQIVLGKMIGSLYAFRAVFAILTLQWLLLAVFGPWRFGDGIKVMLAILVIGSFFSGIGVLCSLIARTSTRAMYTSLFLSTLLMGAYLIPLEILMQDGMQKDALIVCVPYILNRIGMESTEMPYYDTSNIATWGILVYLIMGAIVNGASILFFDYYSGRSYFSTPPVQKPSTSIKVQPIPIKSQA